MFWPLCSFIDVLLLSVSLVPALHPLLYHDLTLPFFGQMDGYLLLIDPVGTFSPTDLHRPLTTGPTLGTAQGKPW